MYARSRRFAEYICSLCVRKRVARVICDVQSTRMKVFRRPTQSTAERAQYVPEMTQTNSSIPYAVCTIMPSDERIN